MTEQLPVIDLSGLESSDHIALHRIAREIGKACRTIGFFYVVNHGVADRSPPPSRNRRGFSPSRSPKSAALAIERWAATAAIPGCCMRRWTRPRAPT